MLGFFKQRTANSKLVSYAEVIRAATDLFEPSFEAKGVRVIVNLPHSLPGVSVNVDELQEVLINILENEREALGRDNDLHVSAQTRDLQIVIRIEDNGPGLGPDPERLFEAFYTTKSTGTGCAGAALATSSARMAASRARGIIVTPVGGRRAVSIADAGSRWQRLRSPARRRAQLSRGSRPVTRDCRRDRLQP
jgi:C4-dicarboxylate-specific signal transduction histidine kinase